MKNDDYHIPVLLHAATDALINDRDGVYVDVTFGGGGHSRELLNLISEGRLIALDQDADAFANSISDDRFLLLRQNFRNIQNVLMSIGVEKVDGILADLGVSSHQFDELERGFSFRYDAILDMRMNQDAELRAIDVVNDYSQEKLSQLFIRYGEFRKGEARKIVNRIFEERKKHSIDTTGKLADCVGGLISEKYKNQFLARVFQSIRIEVNRELNVLEEFLLQIPNILKPNGVISVITYHSLEDRLVKNFFRTGDLDGILNKDIYGFVSRPLDPINRKPIIPSQEEIVQNPRARSAKLRMAKSNNIIE